MIKLKNQILLDNKNIIVDKECTTSLPKKLRQTEESLKKMRNKCLAHNDKENNNDVIKMSDIYSLVNELRMMLNRLAFSRLDSRVKKIEDKELNVIELKVSLGFGCMIQKYIK